MIVTFAHYKGGTGKTTSCLNIAGHLARAGKKVLVVDLDPQGNLTTGLGIDKNSVEDSMYHVMNHDMEISDVIVETGVENLHLAPATVELGIGIVKTYKNSSQARILENSLKSVKEYYDFVLIDTPPVYSHFIVNGMVAADKVILVMDPGIFSLEGIETLKDSFSEFFEGLGLEFDIDSVLITRCQSSLLPWKKNYSREVMKNVERILDRRVYLIPFSDDIYGSHAKGMPVTYLLPKSKVSKAYKKVADRLIRSSRFEGFYL